MKQEGHSKQSIKFFNKQLTKAKAQREKIQKNFDRTQEVVETLKKVDNDLFNEINQIKDADGNITDIYVKTIHDFGEDTGHFGTTNLAQDPNNPNKYYSEEYQGQSGSRGIVSVKINSRSTGTEDAIVIACS